MLLKYFEKYQVGSGAKKVGSAVESTACGKYYIPYPEFHSISLTALSENSITPVTLTSGSPSCVCGGVRYSAWCYELDLWRYQYITLWPEFQYIFHLDIWIKIWYWNESHILDQNGKTGQSDNKFHGLVSHFKQFRR